MQSLHPPKHISAANLPELTLRGMILGAIITVIFTASNVYLGLKVGLTFSSAIPAAVISMAVLRMLGGTNILENNMVQTQASAAGTLSSIIFILPGLVMIGHWQGFPFWQTFGVCMAGGMLGVVFTIPLRHAMVVQSDLPYPEGVAAAEILRVGSGQSADGEDATDGEAVPAATGMRDLAAGGIVAAIVAFATSGLRLLGEGASWWFAAGAAVVRLPMGFSTALLGAGYLIGLVAGLAMLVGLVIAWGIAVPYLTSITPMPAGKALSAFGTDVWRTQVRFIGAGVIAVAAVWTLGTLIGPVVHGVKRSFGSLRPKADGGAQRTEQDMAPRWILLVTLAMVVVLVITFAAFLAPTMLSAGSRWTLITYAVIFAVVFGFLVAAACGYMAGLIGSSSSPISGIGIIAITLVSLLLLAIGADNGIVGSPEASKLGIALAIFTTSAVVAVATISNDNLQDLKTGWLVGATPWRQQVALLIGCVAGAAVISPVLELLYNAYGFPGALPRAGMDAAQALSAPQATLMTAIATGIFTHQLEWNMVIAGIVIGVLLIAVDWALKQRGGVARLPVLAVGIGIYLPPTISTVLVTGAVLAWVIEKILAKRAQAAGVPYERYAEVPNRHGVLLASGLIVGESLVGVLMAAIIGATGKDAPLAIVGASFEGTAQWLGLIVFALVCWAFARRVLAVRPTH
ncbi:OPT family oligopeptide transporter [Ralstonia mojiangensis]|uniref:OPT family oligopeptide transporter n=1 Tax=Ralstonia mojiangensis TaxID=2953895 RepID=UPI0021B3FE8D|nr:oligopeptide transporter, OPT family [Ralstonia mojiangensis]MCT7325938.1 oligopeptide transporter, OPT family [Ralstonia mojiangensis]